MLNCCKMDLLQILVTGSIFGSLIGMLGLGFGVLHRTTGVFHFGLASTLVCSAYAALTVSRVGGGTVGGMLTGVITGALLGALLERLFFRPLAHPRDAELASLLTSLAIYIVMTGSVALTFGDQPKFFTQEGSRAMQGLPFSVTMPQVVQFFVATSVSLGLVYVLRQTTRGHALRAVATNPTLAALRGIDVFRVRLVVFSGASAIGGLAGFLIALDGPVDPHSGLAPVLLAAIAAILGGSRAGGTLLAGLLLGLAHVGFGWVVSPRWTGAAIFVTMLAALIARPRGLDSTSVRFEEWRP